VLDSSFQRTVSSHSLPKHHVPRIPVFISLHFRATFLPFLHLRPSQQHPTQPTITEISRSPSPTNHTKQSRKYHSLPPQKITEIFPLPMPKKPRKYAYFCDFFWPPSWGTYSAIAPQKHCIHIIHSYNTRIPDSITSLSGLVFRMWI